jgi:hypothetical protein
LLAPRRGHGREVESRFSSLWIWQDRDQDLEYLEEAVLVLEKWGRKLLIMRRLFSYWRNGGCSILYLPSILADLIVP